MADQKAKVVPGIPLAALDAIEDQNVRDVLRALVDAHHVRNGNSGSGDERFITAKEAGLINGRSSIGSGGNIQPPKSNGNVLTPAQVGRIINDLQAEIIESPLFKELGARIDLIDAPDGLVIKFNILKDGVTSLITITNETVTKVDGIQKTVYDAESGLAAAQAKIGEINEVSATSSSAAAQSLFLVRAAVNDPKTGLAKAQANILDEKTARANNDNALARSINTVWAAIGDNSALIQEGSEAVVNNVGAAAQRWNQTQVALKDPVTGAYISSAAVREQSSVAFNKAGALEGKYTVKIDLNGYVSGFGLASTANNGVNMSEFYIRADRFAIGSPNTNRPMNADGTFPPADPINIPFIVTTVGRYVNGVWAPPGTYIKNAFIENGTITTAHIGHAEIETANINDLAVDTLKIGTNAVTIPTYLNGYGGSSHPAGSMSIVGTIGVKYKSDVAIVAMATWQTTCGGVGTNTRFEVRVRGVGTCFAQSNSLLASYTMSNCGSGKFNLPPGDYVMEVWIGNDWSSGSYTLNQWSCVLLGAMR